jgi:hypothetical protein
MKDHWVKSDDFSGDFNRSSREERLQSSIRPLHNLFRNMTTTAETRARQIAGLYSLSLLLGYGILGHISRMPGTS